MSEKEEVLRQISEIKSHLVDKETFFPYDFNAYHVWSVISVVLTLIMVPIYEYSIVFGTAITFLSISIGFIIEGFLTKKVNASYDIDDCTGRQQFIMKNFLIISSFAIIFTTVLATYKLYIPIFILWLFLISMGNFAVGYVLNIKEYERLAIFNVLVAVTLTLFGIFFSLLESRGIFMVFVQVMVVVGLAVIPSWIAYKQKSKEACSV